MASIVGIFSFIVFSCLKIGCVARGLIGPSPPTEAVEIGQTHTLTCSFISSKNTTGNIVWLEKLDISDSILFVGTDKRNMDAKYDNFGISTDGENDWHLVVSDIQPSDEGTYACQLDSSGETHLATRTVEVRAKSIDIFSDDGVTKPGEVILVDGATAKFDCKVIGTRPAVNLVWYHKTSSEDFFVPIQSGFSESQTVNADDPATYDTVSRLTYTTIRAYNRGYIKCDTSGQTAVPVLSDQLGLTVHWAPEVNVTYDGTAVICKSSANPEVLDNDYVSTIDAQLIFRGSRVPVEIAKDTTINCVAKNVVNEVSDQIAVKVTREKPEVEVTYDSANEIAKCTAYPFVTNQGYTMKVGNLLFRQSSVSVRLTQLTKICCSARNAFGTGHGGITWDPSIVTATKFPCAGGSRQAMRPALIAFATLLSFMVKYASGKQ